MLDTHAAIETPEGIELHLVPAGPVPRALAYVIDFLIRSAILIPLSIALSITGQFGIGILLILAFVFEWFYPVFFEVLNQGATPGKKMMGLWVVQDDGTPIQWEASMIRNILRAADFLPMLYTSGLISMSVSQRFKRLGDLAAGTLVVYKQKHASVEQQTESGVASRPSPVPLTLREQQAMIAFKERKEGLTEERRDELAAILKPLVKAPDEQLTQELDKIARGLQRG